MLTYRLNSKSKKVDTVMTEALKESSTDAEKNIHAIFKNYLENDILISKKDDTVSKAKLVNINSKDSLNKNYKGNDLMFANCEEGIKQLLLTTTKNKIRYRIEALQDSYNAFNQIFAISEEDIFKEIMRKGGYVTDKKEIDKFVKEKNEAIKNKFALKEFRRPRDN